MKDNKAFERATGIFLGAEAGRCEESAALREVHNHIRTEERLYSMGKDLHKNFRMVSNLICVEKIHSVFSGGGKSVEEERHEAGGPKWANDNGPGERR